MSDHFKTEKAAEDFCSGLQRRFIRALVLDPSDHCDNWQVISPDLDFRREERVWESAAEALAERIGAEVLAALTQPQTDEDARIEREIAELERRADKLKKRYHGDLEARCESLAREVENPAVHGGRTPPWFKSIAASIRALPMDDEEPTPYAKAFRERVCPVPEFPGIEKEES